MIFQFCNLLHNWGPANRLHGNFSDMPHTLSLFCVINVYFLDTNFQGALNGL